MRSDKELMTFFRDEFRASKIVKEYDGVISFWPSRWVDNEVAVGLCSFNTMLCHADAISIEERDRISDLLIAYRPDGADLYGFWFPIIRTYGEGDPFHSRLDFLNYIIEQL